MNRRTFMSTAQFKTDHTHFWELNRLERETWEAHGTRRLIVVAWLAGGKPRATVWLQDGGYADWHAAKNWIRNKTEETKEYARAYFYPLDEVDPLAESRKALARDAEIRRRMDLERELNTLRHLADGLRGSALRLAKLGHVARSYEDPGSAIGGAAGQVEWSIEAIQRREEIR